MKVVSGAKVPRVRKFHGTKVLGTFAPEERKFYRSESSMERKLLPRSECSTERKFHGSESSLYGLFAPGNESVEERTGQKRSKVKEIIVLIKARSFLDELNLEHLTS